MATKKTAALSLEGMIEKYGIGVLLALHNPAYWEVVGGGIGGGLRSAASMKQLKGELHEVYGALLANAKAGDAISGAFAARVATQKAALQG